MNISLSEIAAAIDGNLLGDSETLVLGLSSAYDVEDNSLVFIDRVELLTKVEDSNAAAIIVPLDVSKSKKPIIQVANPFQAFIKLMQRYCPKPVLEAGIHSSAVIHESAKISKNAYIGPFVVIGAGSIIEEGAVLKGHIHIGAEVTIGARVVIHPQVSIYDYSTIGSDTIIHSGAIIGSDGFGYTQNTNGEHTKIPHLGRVEIGASVEIGANTVIDRATIGKTCIGDGTKIDNLVQIAHSVRLGKNNILCAFTGIAGSTVSGDNVLFAANVGVSDHVQIDSGVILGARTGVPPYKHLKAGNIYLGNPARPKEKAIEHELSVTRIPFIRKQIKELREKVEALEKD